METRRDAATHKKKKRKGVQDTSVTQEEESPPRRKKQKKKRLSAECAETIDLGEEEEVVRSQEPDPPTQKASQHKKKKKTKRKSDRVVIDEVSDVEPTTSNQKKKKQKMGTVEDKAKKCDEKKKKRSRDVMAAIEGNTSPAELGGEGPEPIASGVELAAVPSQQEKQKRKRNMKEREDGQEPSGGMDLLPELMSFVPDLGTRSPEIISRMLRMDLHRFREFRKKGIELRWGRFLKKENLKIQENVGNFLALTGIETGNKLFFPERYLGEMDSIKKLRVLHSFQERIAEDIPRPCFKVYTRGKKIFDDRNYLGRFTEEENVQLQKMQRLHGNDWKTISRGMDRSVFSLQKRFNMIATASGPWSQKEVDLLVGTMKDHLEKLARGNQHDGREGEDAGSGPQVLWLTKRQLYFKLPWKSISEKVTGRSWLQCREKWFSILKPKMVQRRPKAGGAYTAISKIKLIKALYAMDLEDAAEIDWEQVADGLGNVTPYTTQKIFNMLKITRVPHSSALSFCELIDFLHDKVIPVLMEKVKQGDSFKLQNEEEVQQRYMLSEIISEEYFVELDNTT